MVVLTTFDTADEVEAALHAGASGYLLKDTEPQRIVEAVLGGGGRRAGAVAAGGPSADGHDRSRRAGPARPRGRRSTC